MGNLATLLLLALQDGPPPLPPPPGVDPTPAAVLDVDGEPVAPGKLPRSTEAAARTAWERLVRLSNPGDRERAPVTAFDLALDLRLKLAENRTNQFPDARYAYVAPAWILADTGHKRRHLRGPKGDWLVDERSDPGRALVRLDVGRENAEDRRQIDEALEVARLFVGLVDPGSVRVIQFAAAAAPEALLPESRRTEARGLEWWELHTPDVRPGQQNQVGARILLGLMRPLGIPRLALVDDVRAKPGVHPTTSCIELAEWHPFDGWVLPRKILVLLPRIVEKEGAGGVRSRAADGWRPDPAMDLFVKKGSLRPALKPEDFEPPSPEALRAAPSGG